MYYGAFVPLCEVHARETDLCTMTCGLVAMDGPPSAHQYRQAL